MMAAERGEAERLAQDPRQAAGLVARAMRKAKRQEGRLARVWDDLMKLLRLARAWATGAYREVPWKTIVLVLAAILYFVNPADVIPDVLFAVGYLDDATVIAWVLRSVKRDLEKFAEWEAAQGTQMAMGSS